MKSFQRNTAQWVPLLACISGVLLASSPVRGETVSKGGRAKKASAPLKVELVDIAAGCVTVGPAEPFHAFRPREVCLPAFQIDRTEVTVEQYRACVAAGKCKRAPKTNEHCNSNLKDHDQHPANCVSYKDAVTFCKWRGARLPSPDEWERAARGPKMTLYPWGDQEPTAELVVFPFPDPAYKCCDIDFEPVCSRPKGNSPEGVCDLAGNVAEWVAGYWTNRGAVPAHHGAALGRYPRVGPFDGTRAYRGGSIAQSKAYLKGWSLEHAELDETMPVHGFRCAADVKAN